MAIVKKYKDITIYVNPNGIFYCDPLTDSEQISHTSIKSDRLPKLEKAIDEYKAVKISNGKTYYKINFYDRVKKIKAVSNIGSLIMFNDNTTTRSISNASLYDASIEETQEFKNLLKINNELNNLNEEIRALHSESVNKQKEFRSCVEKLDSSYSYSGKTVTLT